MLCNTVSVLKPCPYCGGAGKVFSHKVVTFREEHRALYLRLRDEFNGIKRRFEENKTLDNLTHDEIFKMEVRRNDLYLQIRNLLKEYGVDMVNEAWVMSEDVFKIT
jgi:RecJ-like exonuclease